MATRGWNDVTAADVAKMGRKEAAVPQVKTSRSKYRNVRLCCGGLYFDSRREADYWLLLKAREALNEIQGLERQVEFPLFCPDQSRGFSTLTHQVSAYIADFVYHEGMDRHVVDAKGVRTRMYLLKKKWLELQDGIVVEEV